MAGGESGFGLDGMTVDWCCTDQYERFSHGALACAVSAKEKNQVLIEAPLVHESTGAIGTVIQSGRGLPQSTTAVARSEEQLVLATGRSEEFNENPCVQGLKYIPCYLHRYYFAAPGRCRPLPRSKAVAPRPHSRRCRVHRRKARCQVRGSQGGSIRNLRRRFKEEFFLLSPST